MNNINISIVIPCYNCEKTLEKCVNSVVLECESNSLAYEIILVNDGSTDSTLNICEELKANNKNIIVFSQKNSGPSVARNLGLKNAKGELIALNDSDDMWLSGKLKKQLDFLKANNDIDLVCSKYGNESKEVKSIEISYKKEVFHNFFSPQTSIFRRSVINDSLFPENRRYSEDMYFLLNVMKKHRCFYIPFLSTRNVFGKSSFGESGLSSNLWKMEIGELKNIKYVFSIKKITVFTFFIASIFSLIKFIRRVLISLKFKFSLEVQK